MSKEWDEEEFLDEDEEYEYEYEDEDELPMAMETMNYLEVHSLKKRLIEKEKEIRSVMNTPEGEKYKNVGTISGHALGKVQNAQIFSSVGSSTILLNEFLETLKKGREHGYELTAVDDNMYNWKIIVNRFPGDSKLGQTMKLVERKYGFHCVELELRFVMDMYPFYPPIVKLIRPRFEGLLVSRVSSMQSLQLSHWNPVRGALKVLLDVLDTLNGIPADVESTFNDPMLHPEGSYSELEYYLLRLGSITETLPRILLDEPVEVEKTQVLSQQGESKPVVNNQEALLHPVELAGFGKGLGYSSGSSRGWDVNAYHEAQKENDRRILDILVAINASLKPAAKDSLQESHDHLAVNANGYQILFQSALIPVLLDFLKKTTLLEMQRHESLYSELLDLCVNIASYSHLVKLLVERHKTESANVIQVLHSLSQLASIYAQTQTKAQIFSDTATSGEPGSTTPDDATSRELDISAKVARAFAFCHEQCVRHCRYDVSSSQPSSPDHSPPDGSWLRDEYRRSMSELSFGEAALAGFSLMHLSNVGGSHRSRVKRISQEQADLSQNLPCELESSVFVRVDDSRMDRLRVLITGPVGTPYGFGCFLFDVAFPATYPADPPHVRLLTTGGGSVRFNPNLYNTGKVCLSLLGTWQGSDGEGWDAETSTLLQVLVSIQSLILVPDPYFNEPGYQAKIGTRAGDRASAEYNENIQLQTIKFAMLEHLLKPPAGFEQVVHHHFRLCKHRILEQVVEWRQKVPGNKKLYGVSVKLERKLEKMYPSG